MHKNALIVRIFVEKEPGFKRLIHTTPDNFWRNFVAAMVSDGMLHETIFNATLSETFKPRLLLDQYADNDSTLVHTGTMSRLKEEKTYMYLQEKGITCGVLNAKT